MTRKIVSTACRIASGNKEKLHLGNLDVERDWGWAPEFVEAMTLMLRNSEPRDFVIATGETNRLSLFVELAFAEVGLRWQDHVEGDRTFFRPSDLARGVGDPSLAAEVLGWRAQYRMRDVAKMMVAAELAISRGALVSGGSEALDESH